MLSWKTFWGQYILEKSSDVRYYANIQTHIIQRKSII